MLYDGDLPFTEEAGGKTFLSSEAVTFPGWKEVQACEVFFTGFCKDKEVWRKHYCKPEQSKGLLLNGGSGMC